MSRSKWAVFLTAIFGITSLGIPQVLPCLGKGDQCVSTGGRVFTNLNSASSGTVSVKLQDIPVGKVIQVGELKFVKVGVDQYLSISPGCVDSELTTTGAQKLFTYTGNYQAFTFNVGCEYRIELWGASGGAAYDACGTYGRGSYVSGNYMPNKTTTLYLYIGEVGIRGQYRGKGQLSKSSWNGGGSGIGSDDNDDGGGSGGGATDIRTVNGNWDNATSLNSRIMVAGAGAGSCQCCNTGYSGGLSVGGTYRAYYCGNTTNIYTVNQTAGYSFGSGQSAYSRGSMSEGPGGGGGGYYGGQTMNFCGNSPYGAAGGSSYISGHTGCVAITSATNRTPLSGCTTGTSDNSCSVHYSKLVFTNTIMIDSDGYYWTNARQTTRAMPNPTGGDYASGVGHTGNGYARITRLN